MDEIIRSQLRLPAALHERLKKLAEQSGRSMNAEIVYRLSASVDGIKTDDNGKSSTKSVEERLAEKLARPENRTDLEGLVRIINRLSKSEG